MTKIIAISGKKQSGKTTSMNYIHGCLMKQNLVVENFRINDQGNLVVSALFRNEDGSIKKDMGVLDILSRTPEFEAYASRFIWPIVKGYNFADSLKDLCMGLLGLTYEQCYGTDEQKNSLTKLRWENMPGFLSKDEADIMISKCSDRECRMTAREVLQYVGTDIFRRMYESVWTDSVLNEIEQDQPEVAVIGDCRYLNEVEAVKSRGGLVVRLTRDSGSGDSHCSEIDLDSYDGFDYIIDNKNLSIEESNNRLLEFLIEQNIVNRNFLGKVVS